ncbi:hypothetical protein ECZU29_06710 [Escherichia coli]|nr:hypothetical protein ECZU29_06710 [Escherichia coli]
MKAQRLRQLLRTGSGSAGSGSKAEAPAAAPAAKAEGKSEFAENDAYVHATPLIRRLAREFGVNAAKVKGTGRKVVSCAKTFRLT